jgi:fido (protein-threonine AMPylation protein)
MARNSETRAEYQELSRKTTADGIIALTAEQVRRLEELYQLSLNGEFEPEAEEGVLQRLAEERINTLKQRIERGKAPLTETFLRFWHWSPSRETYVWMGPTRPNDLPNGEFSWQLEWVNKPNPYGTEGSPDSRV